MSDLRVHDAEQCAVAARERIREAGKVSSDNNFKASSAYITGQAFSQSVLRFEESLRKRVIGPMNKLRAGRTDVTRRFPDGRTRAYLCRVLGIDSSRASQSRSSMTDDRLRRATPR